MRKLTIKRRKSSVGCLNKAKVYIEDLVLGDLTINGTLCRFLGEIKNGEEKTFEIENREAKLYVIADKLSRNYCNDYYQLPEGEEDIELSGGNKFNPATGNSFRFDNNTTAGIAEHRKKNGRKGLVVLIVAFIVGGFIGFFGYKAMSGGIGEEKEFSKKGLTITLTDKFEEDENVNYPIAYTSNYMAVFAFTESYDSVRSFLGSLDLYDYANLVIKANGLKDVKPEIVDGMVCFEYEKVVRKKDFRYYAYTFKGEDAFWVVQFAVREKDVEKYEPYIRDWAKTIKVQ